MSIEAGGVVRNLCPGMHHHHEAAGKCCGGG